MVLQGYLGWATGCLGPPKTLIFDIVNSNATVAAAVFGAQLQFEPLQREIFAFSDTDVLWGRQGFHLSLCHSSFSSCSSTIILLPLPSSLSGSLSCCLCVCEPDLLNHCLLKPRLLNVNGLYLSLSAAARGTLPPLWRLKQNYSMWHKT